LSAYNLRNSINDEKLADKFEAADKTTLESAINDTSSRFARCRRVRGEAEGAGGLVDLLFGVDMLRLHDGLTY